MTVPRFSLLTVTSLALAARGGTLDAVRQLALARKVIVTDPYEVAPTSVAALAALALALGVTYWLIRERDDRPEGAAGPDARPQRQHPA